MSAVEPDSFPAKRGNAPMAEREELPGAVTDIMDALFDAVRKLPDA